MNNLLALGLATFLAITTFGCAATVSVPTAADAGDDSAFDTGRAARTFHAMESRCTRELDDRSESTRNHCLAATNLAVTVLRDAARAEALYEYRCAKFGAGDEGNPRCPVIPQRDDAQAAR
jgi:hypothetical protein